MLPCFKRLVSIPKAFISPNFRCRQVQGTPEPQTALQCYVKTGLAALVGENEGNFTDA